MIKQYTATQKLLIGIPCGLAALAVVYFGVWVISVNLQIAFEGIIEAFK